MLEEAVLFAIRHVLNVWIVHYLIVNHVIAQLFELLSMGFQANVNAWLGIMRILTEIASPVIQLVQLALEDQQLNAPHAT